MGDRLENETDKAWAMFQNFRDMGPSRTIKALLGRYKQIQADDPNEEVPTVSRSTADGWAYKYNWSERIRAWDIEQEKLKVAHQTANKKAKWEAEVEAFRDRNKRFGSAAFEAAIVLLNEARLALESDNEPIKKGGKKKRHSVLSTDQALRAFAVVGRLAESSQSSEGTALGITQLLEEMTNPQS